MTNPQEDWKMMTVESAEFTPRALAARAATFDRQVRARNVREYAASALVAAFFAWRSMASTGAAQVAAILLVVAALWSAFHIFRAGSPVEPDLLAPAEVQRRQWRAELQRQKRLLDTVRWTYIAPFVPGFAMMAMAPVVDAWPSPGGAAWVIAGATFALFGFVLWFVDNLNRKAAIELGETIAALD